MVYKKRCLFCNTYLNTHIHTQHTHTHVILYLYLYTSQDNFDIMNYRPIASNTALRSLSTHVVLTFAILKSVLRISYNMLAVNKDKFFNCFMLALSTLCTHTHHIPIYIYKYEYVCRQVVCMYVCIHVKCVI